jgi:prolyl oligopeptidase
MPSSGSRKDNENQTSAFRYPSTSKQPVVDELHGEKVRDNNRWLEDETDTKVKEWVKTQNEYTDEWFSNLSVEDVYEEVKRDIDAFTKSIPMIRDNFYFWYERQPGQDQHVLYRAKTLQDEAELVFDPNTLSDDASVTLSFFDISKTGKYGVYGIQQHGEERNTVYIRDLETGQETEFYHGRAFAVTWCDDEQGFYYTRSNYEDHGGDVADETHYCQVYYHKLGQPRDQDRLLFTAIDHLPKDTGLGTNVSEDGRYLAIIAGVGWRERHIYIIDNHADTMQKLDFPAETNTSISLLDGYVYLTTDYKANNKRILRTDYANLDLPIDQWEEFIPEHAEYLITRWGLSKDQIVVDYFHNVTSKPIRFDRYTGECLGELELPDLADFSRLSTNKDYSEFFYAFATFFSPGTQFRFNPDTRQSELHFRDERSIDEERFTAWQEWFTSKDGTWVPVFVVGPKDAQKDESRPLLLTGYGGYGHVRCPGFVGGYEPWLERGGYYALVNIRGGGEFGDAWHKGGIRENKHKSFDDFIAAAEHCVDIGLTKPGRLVAQGGSNGGLLMGAVMTQRPDLFGAVVAHVPILDMYRYHRFLLAYRWTREWGDPENEQEFQWLKNYSPYHHVDNSRQYPPILLTAGINDTRVHPMHAWKMAAKLQSGHPDNVALLRTQMKAGHGPGKGFYQAMHDHAEALCFMMHQVGMLPTQHESPAN